MKHRKMHCKSQFELLCSIIEETKCTNTLNLMQNVLRLSGTKRKKYRISKNMGFIFKTAAKVFLDPYKLIRKDEEHPEEERYNILGRVGKVLFVVCVFREENVVRMISARIAAVPEKERYYHGEDEL